MILVVSKIDSSEQNVGEGGGQNLIKYLYSLGIEIRRIFNKNSTPQQYSDATRRYHHFKMIEHTFVVLLVGLSILPLFAHFYN